jgi:hypothetical protein
MKAFEHYFKNLGMEKEGVTLHNLICNVLKNTSDDFDLQEAHCELSLDPEVATLFGRE